MPKIDRYDGNLVAFASGALTTERTVFGETTQSDDLTDNINADFMRGWADGVNPDGYPTEQWFNAAFFTNGQLLAYLHQIGVAEYNAAQVYYTGSICNYQGDLYTSLTDSNTGNTPVSSPTQWAKMAHSTAINWDEEQTYSLHDFVNFNGYLMVSLQNSNTGNVPVPSTSTAFWMPYVQNINLLGTPTAPTAAPGTNTDQVATTAFVQAANVPAGFILPFGGSTPPAGYLACDGSAVSRTTYADLFSAIGMLWGAGDGATTFNLPNMPRRTIVGSGGAGTAVLAAAVGSYGGAENHSQTLGELSNHGHTLSGVYTAGGGGALSSGGVGQVNPAAATSTIGSGDPMNIIQSSAVALYCIKT